MLIYSMIFTQLNCDYLTLYGMVYYVYLVVYAVCFGLIF